MKLKRNHGLNAFSKIALKSIAAAWLFCAMTMPADAEEFDLFLLDDDAAGGKVDITVNTQTGQPMVVYQDNAPSETAGLRLARFDGQSWSQETILEGTRGLLVVDLESDPITGHPRIFFSATAGGNNGTFAAFDGNMWTFSEIPPPPEEGLSLQANSSASGSGALLLDPITGIPSVAINWAHPHHKVTVASLEGGEWRHETAIPTANIPERSGVDMARNPQTGYFAVAASVSQSNGDSFLLFSQFDGMQWNNEGVPTGEANILNPSLAFDPTGLPHLLLPAEDIIFSFTGTEWISESLEFSGDILVIDPITGIWRIVSATEAGGIQLYTLEGEQWMSQVVDPQLDGASAVTINVETKQIFIVAADSFSVEDDSLEVRVAVSQNDNAVGSWAAYE